VKIFVGQIYISAGLETVAEEMYHQVQRSAEYDVSNYFNSERTSQPIAKAVPSYFGNEVQSKLLGCERLILDCAQPGCFSQRPWHT